MTRTARTPGWLPRELLAAPDAPPARRTRRDWTVDALLFAVALLLWAAVVLYLAEPEATHRPGWLRAPDVPLGLAACVALWWRRRFPLGLALLMLPVGFCAESSLGAVTVALFNTGLHLPWHRALPVAGAHVLSTVVSVLLFPEPGEEMGTVLALIVTHLLFCFSWGAGLRPRRQLVVRLHEDAERERAEHARRLADVRRAEREAIAREMHDVLAHRVSLLSVHAGALAYRVRRQSDEPAGAEGHPRPLSADEVAASAEVIRDAAHQALDELREVLTVLRGHGALAALGSGGPQPGLGDVATLVAEAREAGQRVELVVDHPAGGDGVDGADAAGTADPADGTGGTGGAGGVPAPRGQVQRTAYRVVQEGLTNARKHAPGRPVSVTLTGGPGAGLTVAVRNPLPGPAAGGRAEIPGAGAGLTGLEERAALDGGTLRHGPAGEVFELVARLPWPHDGTPRAPDPAAAGPRAAGR